MFYVASLPKSRDGLGRAFADHHLCGDEVLAPPAGPCSGDSECAASTQARGELSSQCAPALNVERMVDRLVRDPH
jgi:hypothetical protein